MASWLREVGRRLWRWDTIGIWWYDVINGADKGGLGDGEEYGVMQGRNGKEREMCKVIGKAKME